MAWKSREDKLPPPSFFSMIVAHLQEAYRGARISREMMQTLRPFFIEAWRNGRTAAAAAQTTCSCNGQEIIPSPVVGVHIAKGSVRPPKGAQRGDVFGADELRQPPKIERLQHKLDRVSRDEQKQQTVETRWGQRVQTTKSDTNRKEAERKQAVATGKRAELLNEARRIEGEISRLRSELNRTAIRGSTTALPSSQGSIPAEVAPPSAVRMPSAPPHAEAAEPAQKRRGRKPHSKATSANGQSPPAPPQMDAQNAAMLTAVQGLLPGLATQLAAEIAKEGEKK